VEPRAGLDTERTASTTHIASLLLLPFFSLPTFLISTFHSPLPTHVGLILVILILIACDDTADLLVVEIHYRSFVVVLPFALPTLAFATLALG
jgi:hypothetical protein